MTTLQGIQHIYTTRKGGFKATAGRQKKALDGVEISIECMLDSCASPKIYKIPFKNWYCPVSSEDLQSDLLLCA